MKKRHNLLVGAIVGLTLFIGIILMARPATPAAEVVEPVQSGVFETDSQIFDFGSISMADGVVSHTFNLKNSSGDSVKVEKLYTSCMCTEATLVSADDRLGPFGMEGHGFIPRIDKQIESGGQVGVEVVFDPTAHGPAGIGPVDRTIFLETDFGMVELTIVATVTP